MKSIKRNKKIVYLITLIFLTSMLSVPGFTGKAMASNTLEHIASFDTTSSSVIRQYMITDDGKILIYMIDADTNPERLYIKSLEDGSVPELISEVKINREFKVSNDGQRLLYINTADKLKAYKFSDGSTSQLFTQNVNSFAISNDSQTVVAFTVDLVLGFTPDDEYYIGNDDVGLFSIKLSDSSRRELGTIFPSSFKFTPNSETIVFLDSFIFPFGGIAYYANVKSAPEGKFRMSETGLHAARKIIVVNNSEFIFDGKGIGGIGCFSATTANNLYKYSLSEGSLENLTNYTDMDLDLLGCDGSFIELGSDDEIVYIADFSPSRRHELFSLPVTGGMPTILSNETGHVQAPSTISSDGHYVAYVEGEGSLASGYNLKVVDLETEVSSTLTKDSTTLLFLDLTFTPSGNGVLYRGETLENTPATLYFSSTEDDTLIHLDMDVPSSDESVVDYIISPTGENVFFITKDFDADETNLYVIDIPNGDIDRDGVLDENDNCLLIPNGPNEAPNNQIDTDNDGFGNACDCDIHAQDQYCGPWDRLFVTACANPGAFPNFTIESQNTICPHADMTGDSINNNDDIMQYQAIAPLPMPGRPGPSAINTNEPPIAVAEIASQSSFTVTFNDA